MYFFNDDWPAGLEFEFEFEGGPTCLLITKPDSELKSPF